MRPSRCGRLAIRHGRFNFEFDMRIYPNGFTAADFGKCPGRTREDEVTEGVEPRYRIAIGNGK